MALAAKLYRHDERRSEPPDAASAPADRGGPARPVDASIVDLSERGLRVAICADLSIGTAISIGLPGVGLIEAVIVCRDGGHYRAEFVTPIAPDDIARATMSGTVVPFPAAGAFPEPLDDPAEMLPMWSRVALGAVTGSALWGGLVLLLRGAFA